MLPKACQLCLLHTSCIAPESEREEPAARRIRRRAVSHDRRSPRTPRLSWSRNLSSLEAFAPITLVRGRFRQRERGTVARPRAPAPGRAEEKPELHTTPRLSQHTEALEGLAAYATREPTVCTICRQTVCSFLATLKRGCSKTGSNHRGKTQAPGDCTAEHALDAHFSSVPPQLLSHGPFPSPANRKHGCATDARGARRLKLPEQDGRNGREQIRATGQQ
jgi:hypothetical protein